MQSLIEKAKKIKLVIFDVDGVLTDGHLYFNEKGVELKAFHVHDGEGIKLLLRNKIEVAIITHHDSPIVLRRMEKLGVEHIFLGEGPKLITYETLIKKLHFIDEQVAYLGDDLADLPVIQRVGFGIAPANATSQIIPYVDWQTRLSGGYGAAREVCDFILDAQGLTSQIIQTYLTAHDN
ncbi:MAG: HAD hydrolase family protein [Gammaproteobacteria bacterium]|nr:HAD hydrolase family protein [Gammaproteobacteria bacterium]